MKMTVTWDKLRFIYPSFRDSTFSGSYLSGFRVFPKETVPLELTLTDYMVGQVESGQIVAQEHEGAVEPPLQDLVFPGLSGSTSR